MHFWILISIPIYTVLHMFRQVLFGAGNQGNHQNFEKSLLTNKLWHVFMGMKQKKNFFLKKKIQNGRLKKTEFFNFAKSWAISAKISWIGPWVSRIDWCEGHQCDSTYMAVRLSEVTQKRAKNTKKAVLALFLGLRRTAWQPYRLSHIDALRINQSY